MGQGSSQREGTPRQQEIERWCEQNEVFQL
jgi:hypothetical protein